MAALPWGKLRVVASQGHPWLVYAVQLIEMVEFLGDRMNSLWREKSHINVPYIKIFYWEVIWKLLLTVEKCFLWMLIWSGSTDSATQCPILFLVEVIVSSWWGGLHLVSPPAPFFWRLLLLLCGCFPSLFVHTAKMIFRVVIGAIQSLEYFFKNQIQIL